MAWSRIQAEQLGPAVFSVFQVFVRVFLCALVVPPELPGAPKGTSPRRRGRTRRSACLISVSPSQYVYLSICLPVCWCVTKAVQLATSTSQYATTDCLSDPGTCPPVVGPSPSVLAMEQVLIADTRTLRKEAVVVLCASSSSLPL